MIKNIFKNKKVLITGHTGFKGSWLSIWLSYSGAKVYGISKDVPSFPSHFSSCKLKKKIYKSKFINIYNYKNIYNIINDFKPDYIFHLAAQALVKKSYLNTLETWKTNTIGTLNILEALKNIKFNKEVVVVLITSDKVYENIETKKAYKENDTLSGVDPYGASKSAAEIGIKSYIESFYKKKRNKIFISIARAGNVVGGGDWSEDRLIPDCIKSWQSGNRAIIRNPNSTRPWQHVLDVLYGYIKLSTILKKRKNKMQGEAFNFGPSLNKNYRVIDLLKLAKKQWPEIQWKIQKGKKKFKENSLLHLNSKKAARILNWKQNLSMKKTLELTVSWYKDFLSNKDIYKKSLGQIKFYEKLLKNK